MVLALVSGAAVVVTTGALAAGVAAPAAGETLVAGLGVVLGAATLGVPTGAVVGGVAASATRLSAGCCAATDATLELVSDPCFDAWNIVHPVSPAAARARIRAMPPNLAPHFKERN